jgi:ubiquinone/menaquinone biosynthesis C-methylase UbiE
VIDNHEKHNEVRTFWNSRAGLGQWAGSRDVVAKQLEIEAIASYVKDGMKVLEIGCGNGITAIELARRYTSDILAFDYAEEMVSAAKLLYASSSCKGNVVFQAGDVLNMPNFVKKFDLIYTERVLINLQSWESQRKAITDICALLSDGGVYVMCENSQDGLDKINTLRMHADLAKIEPPWHNRYFRDCEIEQVHIPGITLAEVNIYSSTYYFLSRVVNAWLAAKESIEPDYDADINQLALQLPPIGDCGQGRVWLWRKTA